MRPKLFLVALLALALPLGCSDSSTGPDDGTVFVVEVVDERFRVLLRDPALIEQARRILRGDEPQKIVAGRLAAGAGGFNDLWSWHLVPETVEFVEVAIELCDGKPSFVEEDLEYWLTTVQTYCPWSSTIIGEE